MDVLSTILAIVAVILTSVFLLVLYMSRGYRLFAKHGIPYVTPLPALGSGVEEGNLGMFEFHNKYYTKFNEEKVYGYFEANQAVLVIRDLDMLQDIMVKNFNCFVDRRIFTEQEPFKSSLLNLEGDHWRHVRNTVSPTFTTGKLRKMGANVGNISQALRNKLQASTNSEQELKDIMSRYAMDVIAAAGFGVNADSINDPKSPFATSAKKMLDNVSNLLFLFFFLFPWLFKMLGKIGFGFIPKESINFFNSFVDAALENRVQNEDSGKGRSDFIQLMVEEGKKQEAGKKGLTHKEFQGQAFVFIFAGYETVSITLSFLFFLLAKNPLATKKIQEEIDEVLKGDFPSHESVSSLTYLEMCLNESMRMYPAGFLIDRVCTQDCVVQGVSIKKGTVIVFPNFQIFNDPIHFPDPMTFNPERFSAENKEKRHPFAFLPFGQGPRNCIGMRLAVLEMKLAIASVLQTMTPMPSEKTVYPPRLNKFQMKAEDGLWVKFVKREEE